MRRSPKCVIKMEVWLPSSDIVFIRSDLEHVPSFISDIFSTSLTLSYL